MRSSTLMSLFVLFLFNFDVHAQKEQSVLWEVSGQEAQGKSYLFGTVHTADPAVLERFKLKPYMVSTMFGIFEISGRPLGQSNLQAPVSQAVQPPLDSLFNKREYAAVDSFFTAAGLGSMKEHNLEASLIDMFYYAQMLKKYTSSRLLQLDDSISRIMKEAGKPTFRLDDENDPDINGAVMDYQGIARAIVSLVYGEKDEDMDSVLRKYHQSLTMNLNLNKKVSEAIRRLTVRRNLLWIPQIIKKMHEGPCFIAVGAGHLQYTSGLIALLRRHGYLVRPVSLNANRSRHKGTGN